MSNPRFFVFPTDRPNPEDFLDYVETKHGKVIGATLSPGLEDGHVRGIVEIVPHEEKK